MKKQTPRFSAIFRKTKGDGIWGSVWVIRPQFRRHKRRRKSLSGNTIGGLIDTIRLKGFLGPIRVEATKL